MTAVMEGGRPGAAMAAAAEQGGRPKAAAALG
eukprot:COSAG02_NODE_64877_length_259_cov_0.837500_1_plen_31_part_10